jgi:hypothetical protein
MCEVRAPLWWQKVRIMNRFVLAPLPNSASCSIKNACFRLTSLERRNLVEKDREAAFRQTTVKTQFLTEEQWMPLYLWPKP